MVVQKLDKIDFPVRILPGSPLEMTLGDGKLHLTVKAEQPEERPEELDFYAYVLNNSNGKTAERYIKNQKSIESFKITNIISKAGEILIQYSNSEWGEMKIPASAYSGKRGVIDYLADTTCNISQSIKKAASNIYSYLRGR